MISIDTTILIASQNSRVLFNDLAHCTIHILKLARGMKIVHTANRDMVGALHPDSNNAQRVGNEMLQ
jgi:hypothetical protein